jgi:uncharacterized membrane protein YphA (DoxX/SURF4 family)
VKTRWLSILNLLLRLFLASTFALAGVSKVTHSDHFRISLARLDIVPLWMEGQVAFLLPYIEIIAAISLLLGILRRGGAILACGLCLTFTIVILAALAPGTTAGPAQQCWKSCSILY